MTNLTIIAGNLGRDPEMRYLTDGTAVTNFSVAVKAGYGDKAHTLWYRVSVFGKSAEAANEWLRKGKGVICTGEITGDPATGGPRVYNKSDGTPGASFEMRCNNWEFAPGGKADDDAPASKPAGKPAKIEPDEVPF